MSFQTEGSIVAICITIILMTFIGCCTVVNMNDQRHIRAMECMRRHGNWLEGEGKCVIIPPRQGATS